MRAKYQGASPQGTLTSPVVPGPRRVPGDERAGRGQQQTCRHVCDCVGSGGGAALSSSERQGWPLGGPDLPYAPGLPLGPTSPSQRDALFTILFITVTVTESPLSWGPARGLACFSSAGFHSSSGGGRHCRHLTAGSYGLRAGGMLGAAEPVPGAHLPSDLAGSTHSVARAPAGAGGWVRRWWAGAHPEGSLWQRDGPAEGWTSGLPAEEPLTAVHDILMKTC